MGKINKKNGHLASLIMIILWQVSEMEVIMGLLVDWKSEHKKASI